MALINFVKAIILLAPLTVMMCMGLNFMLPINVLGFVGDLAGLTTSLMDIISRNQENPVTKDDIDAAVSQITQRIESSTHKVILTILLEEKIRPLLDAVIAVRTSLIDLKYILESTGTDQTAFKDQFIKNYENGAVVKHIQFLSQLLIFVIPGGSSDFLTLFSESTRCNMTAIKEFQCFYAQLLSDGITLQMIYTRLTTNLTSYSKIDSDWSQQVLKVQSQLNIQENVCKSKFMKLAKEDFDGTENVRTLWDNNKARYTWKWCDVMAFHPVGSFQFLYILGSNQNIFWSRSDNQNKIASFSDKNTTFEKQILQSLLLNNMELFSQAITGDNDNNAARNVGTKIKQFLEQYQMNVFGLVVFFESDNFPLQELLLDTDSPVANITIRSVKMKYCYSSGFLCDSDPLNLFKNTKETTGNFHVFVYATADNPSYQQDLQTNSAPSLYAKSMLIVPILIFFISRVLLMCRCHRVKYSRPIILKVNKSQLSVT